MCLIGTYSVILRFWQDSISQGFIFVISIGKYEKRATKVVKKGEDFICGSLISPFFYNHEEREIKYQ